MRSWNVSRFASIFIAMTALLCICGCKKPKANPFPASGEISGWQKSGDTRVFAAKDLWEYIDGDADQYVKAGVVSTSTADYSFQSRLEAVVDVHTMGNAEGARKLLESARAGDAHEVKIGDGGLAYSQSVTFCKGPNLVRIVAYQSYADGPQALMDLAHGVEGKL